MADEELDPAFRGPKPGWEPGDPRPSARYSLFDTYANAEQSNLAQLARVRVKPTFGPYAYGSNMYRLAQQYQLLTKAQVEAERRYVVSSQMDALQAIEEKDRADALAALKRKQATEKLEAQRAQTKAISKAKAGALASRLTRIKWLRNLRAASFGADLGPPPLTDLYADLNWQQIQRERRAKLGLPQSRTNRRGAGATRPIDYTVQSRTNRTGAAATRSSSGGAARTSSTQAGKAGQRVGESAVVIAPSVPQMPTKTPTRAPEASKTTTGQAQKQGQQQRQTTQQAQQQRSLVRSVLQLNYRNPFPDRLRALVRPRVTAITPPRSSARARSPELDLTPLNGSLLSSVQVQGQQQCSCPPKREPKRKKSGEKGCTNPLISRTVRDGVITIKREAKCPPSRSKSASPPRRRTPTSSPARRSSTRAGGLPFPSASLLLPPGLS